MSNPFALLVDESADPADNVPQQQSKPSASAPSSAPAANGKPRQTQQRSQQQQPRVGQAARKPFPGDRTPATDAGENDLTRDVRNERTAGQRGGRGSGARGPRGGRGGRGSGGNRPMDRHSQTDRVDSHKQEHQAWGGDEGKRELADENEGEKDAQAAVSGVATPVGDAPATPTTAAAPVAEAEPEDNTKTYQEWLAEQEKKNIGGDLPAARKANEGADDSQWKNAVAIKKDEEDEVLFATTKEAKARKQRQAKEKTYIEFEPQYPRPGGEARGGARGGRGRGEGRGGRGRGSSERGAGRGRGGARSNNNNAASVDTSDASAFPSLS